MTKPNPSLCRLPGGGPWRVLDECSALLHNTLRAAERGAKIDPHKRKCVCPRALALYADYKVIKKAQKDTWYQKNKEQHKTNIALGRQHAIGIRRIAQTASAPDMTHALCATPEGMTVSDAVIARTDKINIAVMRALCDDCPIAAQCRNWVLKAELTPGSWGGVYGGLSPVDRKKAAIVRGMVAA